MSGEELPSVVVVGNTEYQLRQFQGGPGHDWLRMGPHGHRSANAEVNALVDEIVRLNKVVDETVAHWKWMFDDGPPPTPPDDAVAP